MAIESFSGAGLADANLGGDALAATVALRARESLAPFNRAGVLEAADVHVAQTLTQLAGVDDADVVLAVALAVRAPRRGHVFVDLSRVAASAEVEREREQGADAADAAEPVALAWPEPERWAAAVADAKALVGDGRPLRLHGTRLYLDRYWRQEQALAERLAELARRLPTCLSWTSSPAH